jgi:hypothetical protein
MAEDYPKNSITKKKSNINTIMWRTRYAFTKLEANKIWTKATDEAFFERICGYINKYIDSNRTDTIIYMKAINEIVELGYNEREAEVMLKFAFPEIVDFPPGGGW